MTDDLAAGWLRAVASKCTVVNPRHWLNEDGSFVDDPIVAAVDKCPVELIEVRRALSRGVVGRVVAHALLLEELYGVDVGRKMILVGKADEALRWACSELGIDVEVIPSLLER